MNPELIAIRVCEAADLATLDECIPWHGVGSVHELRFGWQLEGRSLYLIAWLEGKPVGHVDVHWEGLSWRNNEAVKQYTVGCPELNGLGVIEELQSRGIGTKLIAAAEQVIRERGYKRAGLAVDLNNDRARRLYERLGYQDWGKGSYDDSYEVEIAPGMRRVFTDQVTLLTKDLL